jgi:hypothetical protein
MALRCSSEMVSVISLRSSLLSFRGSASANSGARGDGSGEVCGAEISGKPSGDGMESGSPGVTCVMEECPVCFWYRRYYFFPLFFFRLPPQLKTLRIPGLCWTSLKLESPNSENLFCKESILARLIKAGSVSFSLPFSRCFL